MCYVPALGIKKNAGNFEMEVEMASHGKSGYEYYSNFKIADEVNNYRLTATGWRSFSNSLRKLALFESNCFMFQAMIF